MMPSGNSFGKLLLRAKYAVMTRSKQSLGRLLRGAMGEIKADLIIAGGKFIDVYSGEILDGVEMAILDGRICYVGPNARHTNGRRDGDLRCGELLRRPWFHRRPHAYRPLRAAL